MSKSSKKTHDYRELSRKVCATENCMIRIKVRLIEQKLPHNIRKCYRCYTLARTYGMSDRNAISSAARLDLS